MPILPSALPSERRTRTRARARARARGAAVVAALAVLLAGCGGESLESEGAGAAGGGKGPLVVGSAGFTESVVMAHLYARLLEDAGYRTEVRTVENRELYEPALEKGQIDVVPEYAATLAEFLNAKENGADAPPVASPDVDDTVGALRELARPRGLKVLDPGGAVDQNAFAVTEEFAREHGLRTLSDVGEKKLRIRLAAGDECPDRPFCEPGLEKTYGIDVVGVDPKGVGTPQAKQAVKDGTDQMVLTTTTDATLEQFGLVLLEDDRNLQNADNVLPVVNAGSAGSQEVAEALGRLTEVLTTEDLTGLNRQVDAERRKPADVAASYLDSKDLLKG